MIEFLNVNQNIRFSMLSLILLFAFISDQTNKDRNNENENYLNDYETDGH